jgi:hypothetical protein
VKQQLELHGYLPDIGPDGWPLDRRHPCYQPYNPFDRNPPGLIRRRPPDPSRGRRTD